MKNLIYILCVGFILFGCTDLADVDEDGIAREEVEGGGSGIDDAAAALVGVYSQMNGFTNQEIAPLTLMEHPSDEMMGPTRGTDWSDFGVWRQLHLHTWDASHSIVLDTWNLLNQGVFRATQVIEASSATEQQVAEAKFLRAVFMFYVMDLYGQVPFRPVDAGPDDIPEVFDRPTAFDRIVTDLTEARGPLPSIASGADAATASKEAVDFLLAKLHLNKAVYTQSTSDNPTMTYDFATEDMNEVISRVDNLDGNGYLELEDDFWQNFYKNNTTESSEMVFVLDNEPDNAPAPVSNMYHMTLHYNQTPSSWNGFTTLSEFYSTFNDDNDIRKRGEISELTEQTGLNLGFLIGQQYGPGGEANGEALEDRGGNPLVFTEDVDIFYSNERQGIRVIKYPPNPDDPANTILGTDFMLFRYADARLMKAEAILRGGTSNETALDIVNELRQTRGASQLGSIDLQGLYDERGRELYWEGWRRNDQIRFGTFTEAWTGKQPSDTYRVLFPIPQRAIDTNPNFTQNAGY